jgi:hypothetical protein
VRRGEDMILNFNFFLLDFFEKIGKKFEWFEFCTYKYDIIGICMYGLCY